MYTQKQKSSSIRETISNLLPKQITYNYYLDFVNTDSNTQTNSGPVTTETIPYIRGTSETIARILQP